MTTIKESKVQLKMSLALKSLQFVSLEAIDEIKFHRTTVVFPIGLSLLFVATLKQKLLWDKIFCSV